MINKKIFLSLLVATISVLAVSTIVIAATNMNPDVAPNPTVGTMKTLNDIYHRITEGTAAPAHTLSPEQGPTTGTMHTMEEIYDAITTPLVWSAGIGSMNWDAAKAYCENPANGYTRLPTIGELLSALSGQFLVGTGSGFASDLPYWSSSLGLYDDAYAAIYNGGTGVIGHNIFNWTEENFFRCVR